MSAAALPRAGLLVDALALFSLHFTTRGMCGGRTARLRHGATTLFSIEHGTQRDAKSTRCALRPICDSVSSEFQVGEARAVQARACAGGEPTHDAARSTALAVSSGRAMDSAMAMLELETLLSFCETVHLDRYSARTVILVCVLGTRARLYLSACVLAVLCSCVMFSTSELSRGPVSSLARCVNSWYKSVTKS